MSWAEMAADQDGNRDLSMRLELFLVDTSSVLIHLTKVPMCMEELDEIAEKWETSKDGDKIPVTTSRVGSSDNKEHGLLSKFFVKEPSNHKAGWGIYPLLEQVIYFNMVEQVRHSYGCDKTRKCQNSTNPNFIMSYRTITHHGLCDIRAYLFINNN